MDNVQPTRLWIPVDNLKPPRNGLSSNKLHVKLKILGHEFSENDFLASGNELLRNNSRVPG
jgi:hypothetical protein